MPHCRSFVSSHERKGHFCERSDHSRFLDRSCGNDEEFHKETMGALVFGFLHHCMERKIEVLDDVQVRPIDLAELTGEE
jgi:hypothetical protein